MNKDTETQVRIAVGQTNEKEHGENVGQGTLEGANISAANIECTIHMSFKESLDGKQVEF